MNHHFQETSLTKEAYKKYMKDYIKSIKGKLEEQRPERVKPFMTGAAEQINHILNFFFCNIFIDYATTVVPFPPLHSTPSCTPPPSYIPPL